MTIFNYSMTLEEYIDTNWLELPKELVELFHRERDKFWDNEGQILEERERAEMYSDEVRDIARKLDNLHADYVTARISIDDFLIDIKGIVEDAEYDI